MSRFRETELAIFAPSDSNLASASFLPILPKVPVIKMDLFEKKLFTASTSLISSMLRIFDSFNAVSLFRSLAKNFTISVEISGPIPSIVERVEIANF